LRFADEEKGPTLKKGLRMRKRGPMMKRWEEKRAQDAAILEPLAQRLSVKRCHLPDVTHGRDQGLVTSLMSPMWWARFFSLQS